jgi:hypothetical protein
MGYNELGCYGGKHVPTPNIDSLAAGGLRLTQGYVSAPLCSPSRAGLMTGRYQTRFGHENNSMAPGGGLPLTETTLANRLKTLGYATCMVGKWHLGHSADRLPMARGFDEYFGVTGNPGSYFQPGGFIDSRLSPNVQEVEDPNFYTTDAFAVRAVDWLDKHKDAPWFLYLPFNAIHAPRDATEKYLQRFKHLASENERKLFAMTSAMDDAVGLVLNKVRALGYKLGLHATDSQKSSIDLTFINAEIKAMEEAMTTLDKADKSYKDFEVKLMNLKLQRDKLKNETIITDEYKEKSSDIDYRKKVSEYDIGSDNTVDQNQRKRIVDIDAARENVKALQDALDKMRADNKGFLDTETIKEYNLKLLEAKKNVKELKEAHNRQIREGLEGITNSVLLQGESLKNVWKKLWSDLANEALKALFHVQDGTQSTLGKILSSFNKQQNKDTGYNTANVAKIAGNLLGGNNDWLGQNKSQQQTSKTKELTVSEQKASADAFGNILSSFAAMKPVEKTPEPKADTSQQQTKTSNNSSQSTGTNWGSLIGSVFSLFKPHAYGGVSDQPAIFGETGTKEVAIPLEAPYTGNSQNLVRYAANQLGMKNFGVTPDFKNPDIAQKAMNITVNSTAQMAKTNAAIATTNVILTTFMNHVIANGGMNNSPTVVVAGGGQQSPTMDDFTNMYSKAVAFRNIK